MAIKPRLKQFMLCLLMKTVKTASVALFIFIFRIVFVSATTLGSYVVRYLSLLQGRGKANFHKHLSSGSLDYIGSIPDEVLCFIISITVTAQN